MALEASYAAFVDGCAAQGVGLPASLLGQFPRLQKPHCLQPGDWYGAVALAGCALRKNPDTPLITGLIPEDIFDEPPGIAQTALRDMLNASIERVPDEDVGVSFPSNDAGWLACCCSSEDCFAATFRAMRSYRDGRDDYQNNNPIDWAIIARDNQPVAVMKHLGEQSTMSLTTVRLKGVPYPAGSLFRMDFMDTTLWDGNRVVVPSPEVTNVGFLRLSAFALDPERRRADFSRSLDNRQGAGEVLWDWTLDKLGELARLDMAGREAESNSIYKENCSLTDGKNVNL